MTAACSGKEKELDLKVGLASRKKLIMEGTGNSYSLCILLNTVICDQTSKVCRSVLALIYGHCCHSEFFRMDSISKMLFCFQIK